MGNDAKMEKRMGIMFSIEFYVWLRQLGLWTYIYEELELQ